MRWQEKQRQDFILIRLRTDGAIRRSDLMECYGITACTASSDFKKFRQAYPDVMKYSDTAKRYEYQAQHDKGKPIMTDPVDDFIKSLPPTTPADVERWKNDLQFQDFGNIPRRLVDLMNDIFDLRGKSADDEAVNAAGNLIRDAMVEFAKAFPLAAVEMMYPDRIKALNPPLKELVSGNTFERSLSDEERENINRLAREDMKGRVVGMCQGDIVATYHDYLIEATYVPTQTRSRFYASELGNTKRYKMLDFDEQIEGYVVLGDLDDLVPTMIKVSSVIDIFGGKKETHHPNYQIVKNARQVLIEATHAPTGIRSRFYAAEHANFGKGWMMRDFDDQIKEIVSETTLKDLVVTTTNVQRAYNEKFNGSAERKP